MIPSVIIDKRIVDVCPGMRVGLIRANVQNTPTGDELWQELELAARDVVSRYELLEINKRPAVAATRRVYKHFGNGKGSCGFAKEPLRFV